MTSSRPFSHFALRVDGPTSLEQALYAMLEEYELPFEPEKYVLGYYIDAYAPRVEGGWNGPGKVKGDSKGTRIAFEADGPHHFRSAQKKRDEHRDAVLLHSGLVDAVVRLSRSQLAPWL